MRAYTLFGAVLIGVSTAAIAQVATAPTENKTATVPANEAAMASAVGNNADPSANTTGATGTADDAPPADASPSGVPPK